jgi:hypothetical protein
MKRKSTQPAAGSDAQKKVCREGANKTHKGICLLVHVLAQYGLLESITSHLFPADLYSLASSSRSAYRTIFPRKESRLNLLKKMDCDGTGIQIRNQRHIKSPYFVQFGCAEIAKCAAQAKNSGIESRSCFSCGVTTCDECRIHCVYQNIFQAPDEDDELPNFSGFVLLNSAEMGILSPAHLGSTAPNSRWGYKTHHDMGILDSPLEATITGTPESIDEIINTDLGTGQLKVTYASNLPHPSPTIQAFWEVTEERKRQLCNECFRRQVDVQQDIYQQCHCTLKSRFLDRWLCLKCYQAEEMAQKWHGYSKPSDKLDGLRTIHCSCGQRINDSDSRHICSWCSGEVATCASALNPVPIH